MKNPPTNPEAPKLIAFKHSSGLTWNSEVKASDIRNGKRAFAGWDNPRRTLFLTDLCRLIGSVNEFTLIAVVIDKTKIDVTQTDRMVKPQVRSLELLLERYNGFLRGQTDKSGIVILDPMPFGNSIFEQPTPARRF